MSNNEAKIEAKALRPDLIATLQAIAQNHSSPQAEWEKSHEIARSTACDKVFLELSPATGPSVLQEKSLVNSALKGLAFTVKDLFDVAGQPTLAGSTVRQGSPAALADCPAVARLKSAGGANLGRTNMVEFAFSGVGHNPHYGTPAAWDAISNKPVLSDGQGHVPGGSSSGAAVSVATGAAFIGLGSDTGGSIRIPAALNGLVGFKNTARLVPTEGALPLSTTMDTVCAMTRSVRDAVLVHELLAARHVARASRSLSSYRLAVPLRLMLDGLDSGMQKAWERCLSRLSQAGAKIVDIEMPEISELAGLLVTGGFSAAESYTWHRHLLEKNAAGYDPRVAARIVRGANMKAFEYLDLQVGRKAWIARMQAALNQCDAALSPTVPIYGPTLQSVAPGAERDEAFFAANTLLLRNTSVVNMLDGCALSLPMHEAGELPSSLMIWQGPMKDDMVLNISLAIEAALSA
jgi:amidase/aspartyl-tRNA(Asn)/glutamyl-tRNA(Gln) amidotransferase subunit A